jgi:beta-lactamase class A
MMMEKELMSGTKWVVRRIVASTAIKLMVVGLVGCGPRGEVGDQLKRAVGRTAVAVTPVDGGEGWHIRGDEPFAAGDSAAVFVLAELFRQVEVGKVTLDEQLAVETPTFKQTGPNARFGVLASLRSVGEMSVHDLTVLTLAYADPTAINILIERLTFEAINANAQDLGAKHTSIVRKIGFAAPPENYTTANDVALVWSSLTRGEALSPSTRMELAKVLRSSRAAARLVKNGLAASDLRVSYDGDSPGRSALVHASGVLYIPGSSIAVAVLGENLESIRAGEDLIEKVAKIIQTRHEERARVASR